VTPLDDDYLRAHTVGELTPLSSPIRIADYDPEWPELFASEASKIRTALGDGALGIEHVGSTSVPGLAAKPIIDIVLLVADSSRETGYVPALERAGYSLRIREPGWHEHRMFRGAAPDVNLHVFSQGCPEVNRMLVFRDRLRSHPEDRELYAASKRSLARQEWRFTDNYADAKTAVVEEILARSRL
jgi:GrpB-like predicted nucleotidyltransferase (UPF0157 family)